MEKEAIAEFFLDYENNGKVCRRCAECGRLTKEGWYFNGIKDHARSVTYLASVLNRLFPKTKTATVSSLTRNIINFL